jgi:hypothetical protein
VLRQGLTYSGWLIALYLGVFYATNAGSLLIAGANGSATIIKAFQQR